MKTNRFFGITITIVLVVVVSLGNCSSKIVLKPGKQLQRSSIINDAVVVNSAGIRFMAEPGVWYGPENDGKLIVPIRITITNNSEFPMIIRYSDFFMVGPETGNVYPALPPYYFENSGATSQILLPAALSFKPYFECEHFRIAPYSARMYPELPEWKGIFPHDQLFYDLYYPLWAKKELSSFDALIQSEIPEGVLLENGFLSGFVYFETLEKHEKKVILNFRLCEARRGLVFQTISIPFAVHD